MIDPVKESKFNYIINTYFLEGFHVKICWFFFFFPKGYNQVVCHRTFSLCLKSNRKNRYNHIAICHETTTPFILSSCTVRNPPVHRTDEYTWSNNQFSQNIKRQNVVHTTAFGKMFSGGWDDHTSAPVLMIFKISLLVVPALKNKISPMTYLLFWFKYQNHFDFFF